MKKNYGLHIAMIMGLLFCNLTGNAQAESKAISGKNYFYFAPADLFFNTLQIGYERKLNNSNTLAFSGGIELYRKNNYYPRLGTNFGFQYRVNLLYNKENVSTVLKGHSTFAYFAPFLHYRYTEITDERVMSDIVSLRTTSNIYTTFGGFGFGARFSALENRFCLNIFAGGGLRVSRTEGSKKYDGFFEPGYTGIAPKVEMQIGIAF